jgi:hypothetical protein
MYRISVVAAGDDGRVWLGSAGSGPTSGEPGLASRPPVRSPVAAPLFTVTPVPGIRELTAQDLQVRAVGVTTHLATVLTDADGWPTAHAMLWRDNRAWREAEELGTALGPELEHVTGRPPAAESAAARMRMLAKTRPSATNPPRPRTWPWPRASTPRIPVIS